MRLSKVFLLHEINLESLPHGVIGLLLVGSHNRNDPAGLVAAGSEC